MVQSSRDPAAVNIALTTTSQPAEMEMLQPEQIRPAMKAVTFSEDRQYI